VKIILTVRTFNDTHSVTLIKNIKPLECLIPTTLYEKCKSDIAYMWMCYIWLQVFTMSVLYSGPTKIYTFRFFASKCSCRVLIEPAVNRRNNRCVCKTLRVIGSLCYHYDALLYEINLYW